MLMKSQNKRISVMEQKVNKAVRTLVLHLMTKYSLQPLHIVSDNVFF